MLRIAFIGAGRMARHHLRAIERLATPAVVVGVHDPRPDRAEAFATLAATRAFPSMEALLSEAWPDVVHVCTPPGAHFEAAYAALESGAHVYVEKPFALTADEAGVVLDLAQTRRLLLCAGHQLLRDPGFERLLARAASLGTLVQADSHFSFESVGAASMRGGARALARQLVDILPHPLYTLIRVLEGVAPVAGPIELVRADAGPTDLHAVLRAGEVTGRLSISLRAHPVAYLTLIGTEGSLTCDFVRSIVYGAANPGTEVLEKVLDPIAEGAQLVARTAVSLARRLRSRTSYPGLSDLIGAFYHAVANGGVSPISADHLLRVTTIFEELVARIHTTLRPVPPASVPRCNAADSLTVVTGAGGFLGSAVTRALPRVRGIGRTARPDDVEVEDWVTSDLSDGVSAHAVAGADLVVHAAAETTGSYDAHQRNTIDATRHLLRAMRTAGVSRLVLVSSLSVLKPPRTRRERQDERTARPQDPRRFGPYTWGKCLQEELVEREAASLGIATRIIRPGALADWRNPRLPALMGRRLFGRWHLGLGHPGLPIAVCDVERCAEAIAWCAANFEDAPRIVNLLDTAIMTRGECVARLRACGWSGRILWVPISCVALGLTTARVLLSFARGRPPERLAAWSILRPRRYDTRVAAAVFEAVRRRDRVSQTTELALHV